MMERLFQTVLGQNITPVSFLGCTAVSLVLGIIVSGTYMYKSRYTKSFVVTLALMPAIVQSVIMMVNGNIGTGVAVMGAFSLVRFRSIPGNAREIGSVFLAMAVGLGTGMGYLGIAALFTVILAVAMIVYDSTGFGNEKAGAKELKITIPEDLDYTEIFDDIFGRYTRRAELIRVKTSNLGSLYQLFYDIELKDVKEEKEFIDTIRCRNGNLDIVCSRPVSGQNML